MAHVLPVTALELGDPLTVGVAGTLVELEEA
jgi:hypothetical protein